MLLMVKDKVKRICSACFRMARRKKQRRRRRATGSHEAVDAQRVVGFFALDKMNVLCDGDVCIIAGSSQSMQGVLERLAPRRHNAMSVRKTTFGEIWQK